MVQTFNEKLITYCIYFEEITIRLMGSACCLCVWESPLSNFEYLEESL
jgi:hypothetical protein